MWVCDVQVEVVNENGKYRDKSGVKVGAVIISLPSRGEGWRPHNFRFHFYLETRGALFTATGIKIKMSFHQAWLPPCLRNSIMSSCHSHHHIGRPAAAKRASLVNMRRIPNFQLNPTTLTKFRISQAETGLTTKFGVYRESWRAFLSFCTKYEKKTRASLYLSLQ